MERPTDEPYYFQFCKVGTFVRRSDHWRREMDPRKRGTQLGMITRLTSFVGVPDDLPAYRGAIVTWPWIHWEGELSSSLTHPANAVPTKVRPCR